MGEKIGNWERFNIFLSKLQTCLPVTSGTFVYVFFTWKPILNVVIHFVFCIFVNIAPDLHFFILLVCCINRLRHIFPHIN
jgi:hypothetical protein